MLNINKIESSLLSKTFIEKIYFFNEIDSTNDFAKTLEEEDNVLVLTNHQLKGRGRFERSWVSEKNNNLTFTLKKHFNINTRDVQSVNYFAALCTFEGIQSVIKNRLPAGTFNLAIKWPNDILLEERKIAGLLIENNLQKNDFIIGIGVNVNQEYFENDLSEKAISLRTYLGTSIDLNDALIEIIAAFDQRLHLMMEFNYPRIFEIWKNYNDFIGKKVIFSTLGNVERLAQIIDFMKDGGIKLLIDNKEVVYYSGDIRISRVLAG